MDDVSKAAQEAFDQKYITGSEIMNSMGVSRPGFLHWRRSGKLPGGISVNDGRLFIWERDKVQPYLAAIRAAREQRNHS